MKRLLFLILIPSLLLAQAPRKNTAFMPGEKLSYRLVFQWKFIWMTVGTATLSTQASNYRGASCLFSRLLTHTSPKADRYFLMRDTITSHYTSTLVPLHYTKSSHEGKNTRFDEVWYRYNRGKTTVRQWHRSRKGKETTKEETSQSGIYDMLSMVQRTRSFPTDSMKKGERFHFLMTDGGKVERHTLIFRGRKNFKTDEDMTYRCLVFSFVEEEKGKEKEIITFYITDDANHLPVRLDLNLKFGTAKAYLQKASGVRNAQTSIIKKK